MTTDVAISAKFDISERQLFYRFLNSESFPETRIEAAKYSDSILEGTIQKLNKHDSMLIMQGFDRFDYDPKIAKDRIAAFTQHINAEFSKFPTWYGSSKEKFLDFLLNSSPYHLSLKSWLKSCLPEGEWDRIGAEFSQAYVKEVGIADSSKGRFNIYINMMKTLGIYLPAFSSDAFANYKQKVTDSFGMIDEAYLAPLLAISASLNPRAYRPELMGILLGHVACSRWYRPDIKLIRELDLEINFTLFLETVYPVESIERDESKLVLEAIQNYLENIEVTEGQEAKENYWKRIWNGFVSFATSMDFRGSLEEKWKALNDLTAREKFIRIAGSKASISTFAHGNVSLRGRQLNDWFKEPEKLVQELEKCSHLVVPGLPEQSRFLTNLVGFQGPMFQIFSDAELEIIRQWISELPIDVTAAPVPAKPFSVVIAEIKDVAPDVKQFVLQRPTDESLPPFTSGSHISLHFLVKGKEIIRPYSLMGSPQDLHQYNISVRKTADSKGGSQGLHQGIKAGETIQISYPLNNFPLIEKARKYLFMAGGIGITPFMSYFYELNEKKANFELHYAVRDRMHGPYVNELEKQLSDKITVYDFSKNQAMEIEKILSEQHIGTHLYVCGPSSMIDTAISAAEKLGYPKSTIHFERFSQNNNGSEFKVTLARSNRTISVLENKSILEALEAEGLSHPYSCRVGNCGTCVTNYRDSEVEHRDNCLSEEERTKKIAICCSRIKGTSLVLEI